MKELESHGLLNRHVEFLPDEKQLLERKAANMGLTRPELAVLLAYSKIETKQAILASSLPEDPYIAKIVADAFPRSIRSPYRHDMQQHLLYRDMVATELSNHIINAMGFTFLYRLQIETGATPADIIRAYTVASNVFNASDLRKLIESLDFSMPTAEQYTMLYHIRGLLNIATRWFLHSGHLNEDIEALIQHFSKGIQTLEEHIPILMGGAIREYLESLSRKFEEAQLAKEMAQRIATYRAIYTALNIIEVATQNQFDLLKTAQVYFAAGERINLLWFRDQIANDSREGDWNALARLTLRDELDYSQRALTVAIMSKESNEHDAQQLIDCWTERNQHALERWHRLLALVHGSGTIDYIMFFIAIRELVGLIIASR
jgi:glutamate dehydrogenase